MRDDNDELLEDLFRMARLVKPDTAQIEEYFETRLMAGLEKKRSDLEVWSSWAWRLVPWFAVIVIVIVIGNYTVDFSGSGDPFATFTNGDDDYQVSSMIAGG